MSGIVFESSGSILRIQLYRLEKKNTITSHMYVTLVELVNVPAGAVTQLPHQRLVCSEKTSERLVQVLQDPNQHARKPF